MNPNKLEILYENDPIFGGNFNLWRVKKCEFLVNQFGENWFKDKKILELGCAFGNVGLFFKSLGAEVDFSDGRIENLLRVKDKDKTVNVYLHNYEKNLKLKKYYDLIIHFGVLYHLNYWERNLINMLNNCKHLVLDTAVNKYRKDIEFKIVDYDYANELHGPINNIGTLTSEENIEKVFINNNIQFKRFDHPDLNTAHVYDWQTEDCSFKKKNILNNWCDREHYKGNRYWITGHTSPHTPD